MTPIVGCTSSHISFMSPTCRAPISARNISCSGFNCSRIMRVTPIGVLKLDGVASTLYFSSSSVLSVNLVLVLP